MSAGIDYGMGQTNIDRQTGIRYGVIPVHDVTQAWYDSAEDDYGPPHCPQCGNEAVEGSAPHAEDDLCIACRHNHGRRWGGGSQEPTPDPKCHDCDCQEPDWASDHDRDDLGYETLHHACGDYACDSCRILFDGEDAFGESPDSWYVDDGELKACQGGDDTDIFILRSPYYTRAQFCSPCAPGAGHLRNPDPEGVRTYCLGHDWFEDGQAPYPVYRVDNDELVPPPDRE